MIAHVVDAYGSQMAVIKVPVILGGLTPDVPRIVECNGWLAHLNTTNPLTYRWIEAPVRVCGFVLSRIVGN